MQIQSDKTIICKHIDYYCDICGELIESIEYVNNTYIPYSRGDSTFELELKFRDERNNYKIARFQSNSCLCDKCKEKAIDKVFGEIEKAALELGIKKIE